MGIVASACVIDHGALREWGGGGFGLGRAVSIMAEILAVENGVKLPREMEVALAKEELEIAPNDAESALVCQRLR